MTGADLPNASRRADGLATSAALRNKTTNKYKKTIASDPNRRGDDFETTESAPFAPAKGARASEAMLAGYARAGTGQGEGAPFN